MVTHGDCPLLCSEADLTIPIAPNIAVANGRIVVSCPECGRADPAGTRTEPIRIFGDRRNGETIVYITYGDGSSAPLAIQHGDKNAPHSPTGFAWGYGGSGPATLAESILSELAGRPVGPSIYQSFKFEVIAPITTDTWELTGDEIVAWLETHLADRSRS